jgi:hypothetical protein
MSSIHSIRNKIKIKSKKNQKSDLLQDHDADRESRSSRPSESEFTSHISNDINTIQPNEQLK